ncbi:MAG: transposase [Boseongicola sp.]|nr:transposase [Boseongicola sp.]
MSKELNDVAPSMGEVSTLFVALEVSGTSWVLGIGDPVQPDKVGMHRLAPADTAGLLERIGKARAGADGPSRVLLTYEAGYEGFWLARWLGAHAPEIDVVICDPASLEVVRRKRRAKTDRIDARKMVRALRAWDGGDRDAMSPVRIPTVEEEDAKRLLRRRERLVKERLRHANAVSGLHSSRLFRTRTSPRPKSAANVPMAIGRCLQPGCCAGSSRRVFVPRQRGPS